MNKSISTFAVLLAFAVVAAAQDIPRIETFLGYTYFRANSATDVPAFSANGGRGEFVVNFNKWLGFVTDIGAVHNGNISDVHLDSTFISYMWGLRASIRKSRVTPYFQYVLGGTHAGTSGQVTITVPPHPSQLPVYVPGQGDVVPGGQVTVRAVHSQTSFSQALGGGLDIRLSKHVSFRPIALDWQMTRLQNIRTLQDHNQHNLRYSTGLNFTLGAQ